MGIERLAGDLYYAPVGRAWKDDNLVISPCD
jgi:hypothetical protein